MRSFLAISSLLLPLLAGCSSPSSDTSSQANSGLIKATSCAELLSAVQEDAIFKMNQTLDAERDLLLAGNGVQEGATKEPTAIGPITGPLTDTSRASFYSNTTTQVTGVDEADFIKTDGRRIYLLHGDQFMVFTAFPATSLAAASQTTIEGIAREMYVFDAKAVIFSDVDGSAVYSAAGVGPRDAYAETMMPGADGTVRSTVAPSPMSKPLTKITVLTLAGAQATVAHEYYYEGLYVTSRRSLSRVRTIFTGSAPGPAVAMFAPSGGDRIAALEAQRAQNIAHIRASTISDWLPRRFIKTGGAITSDQIACENVQYPLRGTTQHGLVTIETLDGDYLDRLPSEAAVVGSVDTVYENESTLLLAGRGWVNPNATMAKSSAAGTVAPPESDAGAVGGSLGSQSLHFTSAAPIADGTLLNTTNLHAFDVQSGTAKYLASATMRGTVKDQYSIDVQGSTVRLATTTIPYGRVSATNFLSMAIQDSKLIPLNVLPDESPGEKLLSVRFSGTLAVTSVSNGRLFVVDFSGPSPQIVGDDPQFGPVDGMLPIGDSRVLTFGPNVADSKRTSIQLVDVREPRTPRKELVFDYVSQGTTAARVNPKAITLFPEQELLAFPYAQATTDKDAKYTFTSRLEIFRLGKDIRKLGDINHSTFFNTSSSTDSCYFGLNYSPEVRRGIFLDNNVYTISYGALTVHSVSNLGTPIMTLPLTPPDLMRGADGKAVCID